MKNQGVILLSSGIISPTPKSWKLANSQLEVDG